MFALKSLDYFLHKILPLRVYNFIKQIYRRLYWLYLHSLKWKIYSKLPGTKYLLYPKFLSIFLTTKCNLRCFICRREGFKGEDLKFENIFKLKNAIKYASTVDLTGWGECFLYPQLEDVVEYICSINKNSNLIFITTNGTLLSKKAATLLKGRLQSLVISLNAANADTYNRDMQRGSFEKTINNIKEFLSCMDKNETEKITIHFVAHTQNYREIPDFVILARELGIASVSIGNYLVGIPEHVSFSLLSVKNEYNAIIDKAQEIAGESGVKLFARKFYVEQADNYYNPQRDCLDPFNSVFIGPAGNVTPCCFAGAYSMGNVYETDFESVWFGEKYWQLRKRRCLPQCKACTPYVPFDDYNAHFTSYMKASEEFCEIERNIKKEEH